MLVNVHIPDEIAAAIKQYQAARTKAAGLPVSFSRALTELAKAGLTLPAVAPPGQLPSPLPPLPTRPAEEVLRIFEEDRAAGGTSRLRLRIVGDRLADKGIFLGDEQIRGAARRLVNSGHLSRHHHGTYSLRSALPSVDSGNEQTP